MREEHRYQVFREKVNHPLKSPSSVSSEKSDTCNMIHLTELCLCNMFNNSISARVSEGFIQTGQVVVEIKCRTDGRTDGQCNHYMLVYAPLNGWIEICYKTPPL